MILHAIYVTTCIFGYGALIVLSLYTWMACYIAAKEDDQ